MLFFKRSLMLEHPENTKDQSSTSCNTIQERQTMNTPLDADTLVALVVNTAKNDTTTPDLRNPRVGWRTDELLTKEIDALVVYGHDDPVLYALIARRIHDAVSDLSEAAVLAKLAIFRGERIQPVGPERKSMLDGLLKELRVSVSLLPEGTRKQRCLSLLQYHAGVFYDAYDCFAEAARAQFDSELEALKCGDAAGAAVAGFVGEHYVLKRLLCEDPDESARHFERLKSAFDQLLRDTNGSSFQVSWGEGNAPVHMIEACTWLDKMDPDWARWVETARRAAAKLGAAFSHGAEFVRAADLYYQNEVEAIPALQVVAEQSATPAWRATALLLLARRALLDGNKTEASNLVKRMPLTGAFHVVTIARRLIG